MADVSSSVLFAVAAPGSAVAAHFMGVPSDAIMWAGIGAFVAVTQGPRVEWAVWPVLGALGAFALSLGLGALSGAIAGVVVPLLTPAWGLPGEYVRPIVALAVSLMAQKIVNRVGSYIERARLPGESQ